MKRAFILACALSLVTLACELSPAPTETPEPPPPTEQPTTPPEPTHPPTFESPIHPEPGEETVTYGWTKYASTGLQIRFEHPGQDQMIGRGQLPSVKQGFFLTDPEWKDYGFVLALREGGDPAQLLAAWGSTGTAPAMEGVLTATVAAIVDGDPVTVSRIEASTKISEGDQMVIRATFVPHQKGALELNWFAKPDLWDGMQETFARILDSIELWYKYEEHGLQTMYLHDWPAPSTPPEGAGTWFKSPDGAMGLIILLREFGNPVQMLSDWSPDSLAVLGFADMTPTEEGEPVDVLGGAWESKSGQATSPSGGGVMYVVAMAPNRDRVLEVIIYASEDDWEYARGIADVMLGLMGDLR